MLHPDHDKLAREDEALGFVWKLDEEDLLESHKAELEPPRAHLGLPGVHEGANGAVADIDEDKPAYVQNREYESNMAQLQIITSTSLQYTVFQRASQKDKIENSIEIS